MRAGHYRLEIRLGAFAPHEEIADWVLEGLKAPLVGPADYVLLGRGILNRQGLPVDATVLGRAIDGDIH